jgi:hypothetical protein
MSDWQRSDKERKKERKKEEKQIHDGKATN